MLFKDISYVQLSGIICACAILVKGILSNNSIKNILNLDLLFRRR